MEIIFPRLSLIKSYYTTEGFCATKIKYICIIKTGEIACAPEGISITVPPKAYMISLSMHVVQHSALKYLPML